MSTLAERLSELLTPESGLTQSGLAAACGIKPPSVSDWISGKTKSIRSEHLHNAAKYLNVSAEWLATGKEPRGLEHSKNSRATALAEGGTIPVSSPETQDGYVRVEQAGEADMGDGIVNEDYPDVIRAVDFAEPYIRTLIGFVPPPGRLQLVTGRGDSMMPTIQPGDVVIVDTGCTWFDGDGLYLVNSGNGQQIKRLIDKGVIHVASDNREAYGDPFPMPEGTVVGGKVYLRNRLDRLA